MKLYYTVISAFSRKCRILARELGIIQDIQEIITTMRSSDSIIMSINPTGKVPALITNENQLITESYAICNYLEKIANTNINSDSNYDNWTINGYETVACQVLESIVYRSIEKNNKPKDFIYKASTDYEKFKVNRALDFLEKKAPEYNSSINRVQITICLAFNTMYKNFPEENWNKNRPMLNSLVETFKKRKSFVNTEDK
jgi:glutathione S-transferase